MSFVFPFTETQQLRFNKLLVCDGTRLSAVQCEALQQAREAVRAKLDTNVFMDTVNAIEAYLPHLLGLAKYVGEGRELKSPLSFTWKSSLSKGTKKPKITCWSIHFETTYCFLALGFAHMNEAYRHAGERVAREEAEEKFNLAASHCSKAAGIFSYAASDIASQWINLPSERPPEIMKEACTALSLMALADANRFAVRKAAIKETPKGLLAKICMEISRLYEEANVNLMSLKYDYADFSPEFKAHVKHSIQLHRAVAFKLTASEAYENEKHGLAVAWIKEAESLLKEIQGTESTSLKAMIAIEMAQVAELQSKFSKVNDTVSFESVPSKSDLAALIPQAKGLLTPKPFEPPTPAF